MSYKCFCDRCDRLIDDVKLRNGSLHIRHAPKESEATSINFDLCSDCIIEAVKELFKNKKTVI